MSTHPVRDALRAATDERHRALDARLAALDLAEPRALRVHLSLHAAVLGVLEPALQTAGVQRWLSDWATRRRLRRLQADLHAHGGAIPVAASVQEAVAQRAQALQDRAVCLGTVYVLEGSRLGIRWLQERAATSGSRFFQEPEAAQLWRTFLMQLEAGPWSADALERAACAARATFDAYLAAADSILASESPRAAGRAVHP